MRFADRSQAGRSLAKALSRFKGRRDLLVLALPRGGVPVAYEVARRLKAPLDVLVVRKLGAPRQEELAMGAVATGGIKVLDPIVIQWLGVSDQEIADTIAREELEVERREQAYRADRPPLALHCKTIILVDDGLATGSTMRAAMRALRPQEPSAIIVAVPVAPRSTAEELRTEADEFICLATPEPFGGVGSWYYDFSQTSDAEVRRLLEAADARVMNPAVSAHTLKGSHGNETRPSE